MKDKKTFMGSRLSEWGEGVAQDIDFIVTEDCNLRCKYCYITHKASNKVMTFEVAKKFIDYFLSQNVQRPPSVILNFIGGEPFIEVDLIDQIADYFKMETFKKNMEWSWNYRLNICTNGVNYSDEKVQRFISKNKNKISVSITVDGTKEKHDLQRVFKDGTGSYDIISKNIPLWLSQFSGSTKVTFAHDDLPLLKESIVHLWNLGIVDVSANVVFENVWQEGDDKIFEEQIISLADYMIDNELYNKYSVSIFSDLLGGPLKEEDLNRTSCGAGKMVSLGPNGKIYPCIRYKDYSLNNHNEICIGTVDTGIDPDKVLPFKAATYKLQCDSECLNCEVASGCMFCQGQSYDAADTETNFQRAKYICKMHKARVRANNYFFARLRNEKNIYKKRENYSKKLNIMLSDDFVDICEISNSCKCDNLMDTAMIERTLDFCREEFFLPVFLHSQNGRDLDSYRDFKGIHIQHIVPAKYYEHAKNLNDYILVFDKESLHVDAKEQENVIYNLDAANIKDFSQDIIYLLQRCNRVHLNILDVDKYFNLQEYTDELIKIKDFLVSTWKKQPLIKEFNKITDTFFVKEQEDCSAGVRSFAIASNGNFYTCPVSYYQDNSIGDLDSGVIDVKNARLYQLESSPFCNICVAKHCVRCNVLNKKCTNEVNVPPNFKCQSAFREHAVAEMFREELLGTINLKELEPIKYKSMLEAYESRNSGTIGYSIISE